MLELSRSALCYAIEDRSREEVIKRLQQQRKNWKELEWAGMYDHSLEGSCNAYELVDGLFVKTDSNGKVFILELPTTANPHFRVLADDHIEFQPGDFALDATQDLIVFIKLHYG